MPELYSVWGAARMAEQVATFDEGDQNFCAQGATNVTSQTSQEAYDEADPVLWFWAIYYLNLPKAKVLITALLQRLIDEGAEVPGDTDPVGNPQGFLDWHAEHCNDRKNAKTCHAVFVQGARLMLDDFDGLNAKRTAFLQMYFVGGWASAMSIENGQTARSIIAGLSSAGGGWFQAQCTYEEFCNGVVEG